MPSQRAQTGTCSRGMPEPHCEVQQQLRNPAHGTKLCFKQPDWMFQPALLTRRSRRRHNSCIDGQGENVQSFLSVLAMRFAELLSTSGTRSLLRFGWPIRLGKLCPRRPSCTDREQLLIDCIFGACFGHLLIGQRYPGSAALGTGFAAMWSALKLLQMQGGGGARQQQWRQQPTRT